MSLAGYVNARREVRAALGTLENTERNLEHEAFEIRNLVLKAEKDPAVLAHVAKTWTEIACNLEVIATNGFIAGAVRWLAMNYTDFFEAAGFIPKDQVRTCVDALLGRLLQYQLEHAEALNPSGKSPAAKAAAAAERAGRELLALAEERSSNE